MEKKTYYSERQNKATQKYQTENLEQLKIWVRIGSKAAIKSAADEEGLSMAEYICDAINKKACRQIATSRVKVEKE